MIPPFSHPASRPPLWVFTRAALTVCAALLACDLRAAAPSSPTERYGEVRSLFEKGDFTRAQYLAESMLKDGLVSPQLFQILGHIRYRQGDLGRASLWYQRAALFPPPVPEVRQNITHIHERTGNVRFPANSFRDQFSSRYTRSEWFRIAMASIWVFVLSAALYYLYVRNFGLRTLLMLVRIVALIVATISGLGWYWHSSYSKLEKLAVVTLPNSKAYTAATVTSGSVTALPPGSEVRKLEERGAWCYVEIPNEDETRRGWVQTDTLTPVWPFDSRYLE